MGSADTDRAGKTGFARKLAKTVDRALGRCWRGATWLVALVLCACVPVLIVSWVLPVALEVVSGVLTVPAGEMTNVGLVMGGSFISGVVVVLGFASWAGAATVKTIWRWRARFATLSKPTTQGSPADKSFTGADKCARKAEK